MFLVKLRSQSIKHSKLEAETVSAGREETEASII